MAILISPVVFLTVFDILPVVMGPIFAILLLGYLIVALINLRCPACSSHVGRQFHLFASCCPKCGVQLRR